MAKLDPATILKYEQILEKDPNSQVFAALAESYREEGQLQLAEDLARRGVLRHPNFPGGLITLGKILRDQNKKEEALNYLNKVTQIAPDNILAHLISAEIYLQIKATKEALKSFKMVLLFNPQHEKAQFAVKKLENLTADEYDKEIFSINPLVEPRTNPEKSHPIHQTSSKAPSLHKKSLDRMLSLVDAFIVRNELDKALELIKDAESEFGTSPELEKRLEMLTDKGVIQEKEDPMDISAPTHTPSVFSSNQETTSIPSRKEQLRQARLSKLKRLLRRIEDSRSI